MRSGLDLTHIDKNVRPQDDLFRFMNGKWLTESKIPDDRASDGAFYWLYEQAEKQVKQIILDQAQLKAAVGSNAQKIGDLYNSFMDEEFIQAQGLSPIAADLKAAQSFKSLDEFLTLLGELEARGLSGLFYTYVSTDNKDSTKRREDYRDCFIPTSQLTIKIPQKILSTLANQDYHYRMRPITGRMSTKRSERASWPTSKKCLSWQN